MSNIQGPLNQTYDATNRRLRLSPISSYDTAYPSSLGQSSRPIPTPPSTPPFLAYEWSAPAVAALTKWTLTADGAAATTASFTSNKAEWRLTAGGVQDGSNLREFYIIPNTTHTNFHAIMLLEPIFFGDVGGGVNLLPQQGIALRCQSTPPTHTGITINNNVSFGVAQPNVGVWKSNLDGTSFQNRQGSFPVFSNPSFPYWIEVLLEGTICAVRMWGQNETPSPWTHTSRARVFNLNSDCGSPADVASIPTPTGPGSAGIIVAHLGTHAQHGLRSTTLRLNNLDSNVTYSNSLSRALAGTTPNSFRAVRV
jgi:hypothetical protein